jgi:hypothetical protein
MARAGSSQIEVTEFGDQLFGRAMLPNFAEAGPGDQFQGGVALRSCGASVRIQPYTVRKVCQNGAIAAWILDQRELQLCGPEATAWEAQEVLSQIEQLVASCAAPSCLNQFIRQSRRAQRTRPDQTLSFLSSIERSQTRLPVRLIQSILRRFETQEDRSLYGLMNAVTSVARDVSNPAIKADLEELGGGVLARLPVTPTPSGQYAGR